MCKNVVGYYRTSSTTNVKGDSRTRQSVSVKNDKTFTETTPTGILVRQILSTISSFEKNNLVEKLRLSRERKSKKNKELGLISRTGNGRCGGKRKLTDTIPNLSNLVLSYKKTKDMRTRKPLTNTKISNLLLEEHNLSVSYKSVGKILEDIEGNQPT